MSTVAAHAAAAAGLARRDLAIFISYRVRFISTVLSGLFTLVLFYYISRLVSIGTFPTSDAYFAFAVVGLVIAQVLASTLAILPANIRSELLAGTLERIVLSPFGPVAGILSMTIFPFLLAIVHGIITIAVAAGAFGMDVRWSTAAYALPVALLASLAFVPFALLLAATVLTIKQAGAGVGFFTTGISLIAGFFFPVSLLPDWIEWLSEVQPFTPALEALRYLLVGRPMEDDLWIAPVKMVGFAAVLLPLALLALRAAVRFAQRRGTIIEY